MTQAEKPNIAKFLTQGNMLSKRPAFRYETKGRNTLWGHLLDIKKIRRVRND